MEKAPTAALLWHMHYVQAPYSISIDFQRIIENSSLRKKVEFACAIPTQGEWEQQQQQQHKWHDMKTRPFFLARRNLMAYFVNWANKKAKSIWVLFEQAFNIGCFLCFFMFCFNHMQTAITYMTNIKIKRNKYNSQHRSMVNDLRSHVLQRVCVFFPVRIASRACACVCVCVFVKSHLIEFLNATLQQTNDNIKYSSTLVIFQFYSSMIFSYSKKAHSYHAVWETHIKTYSFQTGIV